MEQDINPINSSMVYNDCEVCGNNNLPVFLNLGKHPLCDDLVKVGDGRTCQEYPIEITYCEKCNTAHQRYQVPKHTLFPKSYHYRSRFTADVLNGMSELVDACEEKFGSLKEKTVLDIGCNDGSLLNFFYDKGAITIGIDPTGAVEDGDQEKHNLLQGYFDFQNAEQILESFGHPDIITFTNVFAHIEDLSGLINALKVLMKRETVLVIENHYLGAVIERFQFDTFYHEHPRTYSLTSFLKIAESLERELLDVEFPARYGGNIRIYIGQKETMRDLNIRTNLIDEVLEKEKKFGEQLKRFSLIIEKWKTDTKEKLGTLMNRYGKVSGKAFPGRAAILVKLLEIDVETIDQVYEKPGSMKIGHYLPGTRIPIVSDEVFWEMDNKPEVLFNFAWHIGDEIREYFKAHECEVEIVDVLDPKDLLHNAV